MIPASTYRWFGRHSLMTTPEERFSKRWESTAPLSLEVEGLLSIRPVAPCRITYTRTQRLWNFRGTSSVFLASIHFRRANSLLTGSASGAVAEKRLGRSL